MQVLKKFGLLFGLLLLAGCSSSVSTRGGLSDGNLEIEEIDATTSNFRIGVLLPLTGNAGKYGQGLKNSTLMAMEDIQNPNLILQFYDTKSTSSGARVAVENAIKNKSQMIIGPLMSSSVRAISSRTTAEGIPVIAFSTAEEVLQKNVYTLGLLIDEQVDKIISYAVKRGRSNFALLLPDNATGIAVAKSAVRATIDNGVKITHIAFYPPNTMDFSKVLKELSNYEERSKEAKKQKDFWSRRAETGDVNAIREFKKIENVDSIGEVEFDAVLIPESGAKLKSAIAMFGYYDVYAPNVKFLGTSVWENTSMNNEMVAVGSWYPSLSRSHSAYFVKQYQNLFGEKPNSLYSLAYDAVALANAISKKPLGEINAAITSRDGYLGINGPFRIFKNGYNEHSLDIVEVRKTGDAVIETGDKSFSGRPYKEMGREIVLPYGYVPPVIYGMKENIAQNLIYGRNLAKVEPVIEESVEEIEIGDYDNATGL